MYFDFVDFVVWISGIDFVFNMFCGGFINQRIVVMMNVINDGFVEVVIINMDRRRVNYVVQGDYGNFSGIIIDIYNY